MTTAATPKSANRGERFQLLDLLRGIAAIAVLIYHGENYLGVELLPNAYLAVDMFFLLSGFVIAHNYDGKIARGMSLRDFVVQRLIRLYPCFALTFVLGFIFASARFARDAGFFDGWRLLAAAVMNAAFLPAVIEPYNINDVFPFNGAAWSLTFELFANILYWLLFRHLGLRTLLLIITGSTVALTVIGSSMGTIDVGMRPQDFVWGIPRVLLSFFAGVALRRYAFDRVHLRTHNFGVALGVVVLLLSFSSSRFVPKHSLMLVDLATVVVVFPLLMTALYRVVPGPRLEKICKLTGDASYPVYLLQTPFVMVFAAVPQVLFHTKAHAWVPYIGIAHITATIVCALWIDRYFELPLRNYLKARWIALQQRKALRATVAETVKTP